MNTYTKDELETLILQEKLSYEAIGRLYNVTGAAIKKAAKKIRYRFTCQKTIFFKCKLQPS